MSNFNLARKLFDLEDCDSDNSNKSVIYISSSEDESSDWETDCSTDTEQLIARIERAVISSPTLIGGRIMMMDDPEEEEARTGPSSSQTQDGVTPKLDLKYCDREMCYAPPRKFEKTRIELCNTILPVLESPMSPPEHERGPSLDTPLPSRSWETSMRPIMYIIQCPLKTSVKAAIPAVWTVTGQRTHSRMRKCSGICNGPPHEMSPNTSQDSERRHMKMDSTLAAFFSSHPQCRRLPPVTVRK